MNEINYWHEPFFEALRLELYEYKEILEFENEHLLGQKALQIDVVVIKKNKEVEIKKNIGSKFKGHNIFEFKSETDNFAIKDYNKVIGYAFIYASLKDITVEDVTVNIVTSKKPVNVFKYIKGIGLKIIEISGGMYEIIGERLYIQIIINSKLDIEENTFLKTLRSDLLAKEADYTIAKYKSYKKEIDAKNIYLFRLMKANIKTFLEVAHNMPEEIVIEFEEILNGTLLEKRILERGRYEGIKEGVEKGIKEGVEKGIKEGVEKGREEGIQKIIYYIKKGHTIEDAEKFAKSKSVIEDEDLK